MATDPGLYGRSFADVYDDWYTDVSDVDGTVALLSDLAAGGPVLELGSGTGRLAQPLAAAGVAVIALDASPEMNHRCAAKRHAPPIIEADMAVLPIDAGCCDVVFIAFNTICNLTAPGSQQRCVQEAARVLSPTGAFVVEVLVPPDPEQTPSQATSVRSDDGETVVLTSTAAGDDPDHVIGRHVELRSDGSRLVRPWELRWVSPTELDQWAGAVGLTQVRRRADWRDAPFDATSTAHVSVYRRRIS